MSRRDRAAVRIELERGRQMAERILPLLGRARGQPLQLGQIEMRRRIVGPLVATAFSRFLLATAKRSKSIARIPLSRLTEAIMGSEIGTASD